MTSSKKICFVLDTIAYGGAQIVTLELVDLIMKKNPEVEVQVISLISTGFENEIINKINPLISFKVIDFFSYNSFNKFLILKKELSKFDVVHSCLELSNFYVSLINYFTKFKNLVFTFHGVEGVFFMKEINYSQYKELFPFKYRLYINYLQNILFRKCKNFFAVSESTKNSIIKFRKIPSEKISVLYLGLNLQKIDLLSFEKISEEVKNNFSINNGDFVIGYLGRLSYGKGLLEFLVEFKELTLSFPNIKFLIIGDGELNQAIKDKLNELNLNDNCILAGYKSNVYPFFDVVDLIILPSFSEGVPISIMEAMYFSKLVLTSKVGGLSEIVINGVNGLVFDINNFGEIKNIIINIYNNTNEYSLLKSNAHKFILENFDLSKNADKFMNSLNNLKQ